MKIPRTVKVKEILNSRYQPGTRPISWDERAAGDESVIIDTGEEIRLYSTGGQSSPTPGWMIVLTGIANNARPDSLETFHWTLYGLPA